VPVRLPACCLLLSVCSVASLLLNRKCHCFTCMRLNCELHCYDIRVLRGRPQVRGTRSHTPCGYYVGGSIPWPAALWGHWGASISPSHRVTSWSDDKFRLRRCACKVRRLGRALGSSFVVNCTVRQVVAVRRRSKIRQNHILRTRRSTRPRRVEDHDAARSCSYRKSKCEERNSTGRCLWTSQRNHQQRSSASSR